MTVEHVTENLTVSLTPVQNAAAVSISVAEDSTSDTDLLSTIGGVRNWVKSYQDTSAAVNGTITITAKTAPTKAPFIVGNDDVVFTKDANGEWTAEVTITSANQVIYISAKTYKEVELTRGDGVTFISPAQAAGSLTAAKYAFTNGKTASDEKFGPAIFTVELPSDRVPVIDGNLTNWTTETASVGDNRWTISFEGDSGAADLSGIKVIAGMGTDIQLSRVGDDVQLAEQTKYPVANGKVTVTVYVKDGRGPVFYEANGTTKLTDNGKTVKLAKFEDDTYKGWNRWTAEISGIKFSQDVVVKSDNVLTADITINDTTHVRMKDTQQTKVEIINGEGSFDIYVDPDYAPSAGTNPTDREKITFTTDEFDKPTEWVKWTVTVKNFDATDAGNGIDIDAKDSFRVAANHPSQLKLDAEAKHTASVWNGTAYQQDVTFIATAPVGSMPVVNGADANTALGVNATTGVEVVPGDTANTWKVTLKGVTQSGTIYIGLSGLPEISVISDSTGIVFNATSDVTRNGTGSSATYNATLRFEVKDGYKLNEKKVEVYKDGDAVTSGTDYNVTSITRVGTSNIYEIRITLKNSGATDFENSLVSVKVDAVKVWEATLQLDEAGHIHLRTGEPVNGVKEVEEGSYAEFYVTVDEGWLIKASSDYDVEPQDSCWKIISKNPVISDITIALESEAATDWRYTLTVDATSGATAAGDVEVTLPDGTTADDSTPGKGTIRNGSVEFEVTTTTGFVPTVTVNDPNGQPSAAAAIRYTNNAWIVTLTDVVANPEITIGAKRIVATSSAKLTDVNPSTVEKEGGEVITDITIGIDAATTPSRDIVAGFEVAVDSAFDPTGLDKNNCVSFIAYVADGFTLEDVEAPSSWNWVSARVSPYNGGNTIHHIDGYNTVVITVKIVEGGLGGNDAKVPFAMKAPTGDIPTK